MYYTVTEQVGIRFAEKSETDLPAMDLAGWQAKKASIEILIPCRIAHRLH